MATLKTPKGHVFAFEYDPVRGIYSAIGPLLGGKRMVQLESIIRVSSSMKDRQAARQDLIDQLIARGY